MFLADKQKNQIFSNISIILVNLSRAENIGLCARALKNTSFKNLSIVGAALSLKAFEVARRARDLLEHAQVYSSLSEAVRRHTLVIGTTRRKRENSFIDNFHTMVPLIVAHAVKHKVSFLFGRENTGLNKEELQECDHAVYLPACASFPSYNVASAVTIVCHAIFNYVHSLGNIPSLTLASHAQIQSLFPLIEAGLHSLGFKTQYRKPSLETLQRILKRAGLTKSELQLLKSIFVKIAKKK